MARKIKVDDYGRARKKSSPVMLNIRLRRRVPKGTPPPTREEVLEVLQHIVDRREVPRGWSFAFIEWRNPNKRVAEWTEGTITDVEAFSALLSMVAADAIPSAIRGIGVVEPTS